MKLLQASTEAFIKRECGQLSATAAAGSSVIINVTNAEGIAVNDYVVIGFEGSAEAELC